MPEHHIDEQLHSAELALAEGRLAEGRLLAEEAWAELKAAGDTSAPRRRRAGLVLSRLRYRQGALKPLVDLSTEVLPLLRASGPTAELIDTLRMVALGACDTSRFDVALSTAQEAYRLAVEIGDPARVALSTNALACFFERSGDPWQAGRLMVESLALARAQPDPYPVFAALNNLGASLIGMFYMLRDAVPLEEAREPLRQGRPYAEEAVARANAGGDPFFRVFTQGNLGEMLVNLGETEAAEQALAGAMALAQHHAYAAQVARIACSLGELQLLRGNAQGAWDSLRAVLAGADPEQRTTLMRLHHALWRSANALSDNAQALHHLQAYLSIERQRSVTQLRAQSELFVTRMEAEQMRQEAQRQRARVSALEVDVRRDQLTGLGNRRELEFRWPEFIRHAQAGGAPLSVAMIDIDHFKRVNDAHGHATGDRVLVEMAGLLRKYTRSADLVVRLGGEEFLLVLPDTTPERAHEVCDRLCQRVAAHSWADLAADMHVTLSVGLSSSPPYDAETLSLRADAALYRAKAAGRNQVVQV